jgi:formylglycine-generating enzyme required for sulfatase activity
MPPSISQEEIMKSMKKYVAFLIPAFLLILVYSCSNVFLDPAGTESAVGRNPSEMQNTEPIRTEEGVVVGSASIARTQYSIVLKVSLNAEYALKQSKTWVGARLNDVPHTKGSIIPGQFPMKSSWFELKPTAEIEIPLAWPDNSAVYAFSCLTLVKFSNPYDEIEANIGTCRYDQVKSKRYYFSFVIDPLAFSIAYSGNGNDTGEVPHDPNEYVSGRTATVLGKNTLEKTGHEFVAWNTAIDGTGAEYLPGSEITVTDHDLVLYAVWKEKVQESIQMMPVEGGTFSMGATYQGWAIPPHDVTLSSFSMSKTEVTQALYKEVMGINNSVYQGDDSRPVEYVSWYDAVIFCNRLSLRDGLSPAYEISNISYSQWGHAVADVVMDMSKNGYRLPTEAEWEFAARGGISSHGYSYSGSNSLVEAGWTYYSHSETTMSVGTKIPNELGIHDMTGNVFEWCWDWFGMYSGQNEVNPTGPTAPSGVKIIRGGSFSEGDSSTLVAFRSYSEPQEGYRETGFRVARSIIR